MITKKIAVIGCGNIGEAFIKGLLNSHEIDATNILATRKNVEKIDHLKQLGVIVGSNNKDAAQKTDIVFIAVKPHMVEAILDEIQDSLTNDKLIVCFAAGMHKYEIKNHLWTYNPLVIAIPNTAMLVNKSMTCLVNKNATDSQFEEITTILNLVGKTIEIPFNMLAQATVIASCGTAFALKYIQLIVQASVEIGIPYTLAKELVQETVNGAVGIMQESNKSFEDEIFKVTTPGGTTIAGLNEMEAEGFSNSIFKGINKAYNKIK